MTDITDRLRATPRSDIREVMSEAAAEIERLRLAIRRLADQDATLSVQGGNVTVTLDAGLTPKEREAVEWASRAADPDFTGYTATLRGLLERTGLNME